MHFATALAALAALYSTASAQDVTSSATRCTTRFGYYPLPTGTAGADAIPTWYRSTTTTNLFRITSTTRSTVTATPDATTFTDMVTTTTTVFTTTTSTPSPTRIPTPSGFIPLLAVALPTPSSRARRSLADSPHSLNLVKRQTAANHSGGYIVDRNGNASSLDRKYVLRVDCRVSFVVNSTSVTVVTAAPETVVMVPETATMVNTVMEEVTRTVTQVLPRQTVWEACLDNNVVNEITDFNGNQLVFDRVTYRPAQGFPVENELVVDTTSGVTCCIACQQTANCAGSFFVPSALQCHLRLTQPAPAAPPALLAPYPTNATHNNASYPTASYPTAFPTAASSNAIIALPLSTGTPAVVNNNGTCGIGSLSLYLGTIQGQEDFPIEYALEFSNGPCGRLSVWPIPVTLLDDSLEVRRA